MQTLTPELQKLLTQLSQQLQAEATSTAPNLTLSDLFSKYVEFKRPTWKPKTLNYMVATIQFHVNGCPYQLLSQNSSLQIRAWLLANTTNSMSKRVLMHLNAAVKWALKYKLVSSVLTASPFEGMVAELPQHGWQKNSEPNGFTELEKENILRAFKNYQEVWGKPCYYYSMVDFLFLTGCRPSEAIGLRWCDVADDFSHIAFSGSVQYIQGKEVRSEGSKNNRRRKFPCNQKLRQLLESIKPPNLIDKNKLVFPSPGGKAINYGKFSRGLWNQLVDPVTDRTREQGYKKTTPYSCRDTFITEQISKGVPVTVVGKWCDTSEKVINSTYLDVKLLEEIQPL